MTAARRVEKRASVARTCPVVGRPGAGVKGRELPPLLPPPGCPWVCGDFLWACGVFLLAFGVFCELLGFFLWGCFLFVMWYVVVRNIY